MHVRILLMVFMSAAISGSAQYTYWNNALDSPVDSMSYFPIRIEETANGYIAIGGFISPNSNGILWSTISSQGNLETHGHAIAPLISYGGGGGYPHQAIQKLDDGQYLNARVYEPEVGHFFPYYVLLDENLDTVWTWLYNEYPILNGFNYSIPATTYVNDAEFVSACVTTNQDGLRFIRANTNHEIVSDAFWYPDLGNGEYIPDPQFVVQGNGDTLLLCGERYREIDGIDEDFQVYLLKSDFEATDVQILELGNPNICYDLAPGIVKMPNGHVLMLYSKCLSQTWFNNATVEFHAVEINTNNMSVVNDIVLDLGTMDDGAIGQLDVYRLIKNPFGGYLAFVQYVGVNGIGMIDYLLKIDDNLAMEWINPYHSNLENDIEQIIDVISTSDGGFAATGMSQGEFQRQWVFKIDACGYEQPNGCPATINLVNHEKVESLRVWPNPFYSQLKAELPENATRMYITDMTGRMLYEEKLFYPNQQWNLSFLEDGMYLLNIESAEGKVMGQRVVKR